MIENLINAGGTNRQGVIIDIETDGLLEDVTKIHCIVCKEIFGDNHVVKFVGARCYDGSFVDYCRSFGDNLVLIGHNVLSYDLRVLKKLLVDFPRHPVSRVVDTLILSQLANPAREDGNSLGEWGKRLKFDKLPSPDFLAGYTDAMLAYCVNDVELTHKVLIHLCTNELTKFSVDSIRREHTFRAIIDAQESHGFGFDITFATTFLAKLNDELINIEKRMQEIFEPTIVQLKTKQKIIPFNPGSRHQIADRLQKLGWKPQKFTEKGHIIVDEPVLEAITDIPVTKDLLQYLMLQKRIAQVQSWVGFYNDRTGRIHGRVKTLGTISTRCSHLDPNIAQTPAVYSPYGTECRTCWTVKDTNNYRLLGCDASQLELRVLAHYMRDKDYVNEILNGDIHTVNQNMAGLETRDQAKTFIYALIYGAGPWKIGSITGKGPLEGKLLKERFLKQLPSIAFLLNKVRDCAERTNRIKAIDGRYLPVRSVHAALNLLIQGSGAIICKEWAIQIYKEIAKRNIDARFVANVHDEMQIEVHKDHADELGQITKDAMKVVEKTFNMSCPLDSGFKIGLNWSQTH